MQPLDPQPALIDRAYERLVEENGRRGLIVSEIDAARVRELYQIRSALDALRTARSHIDRAGAGTGCDGRKITGGGSWNIDALGAPI